MGSDCSVSIHNVGIWVYWCVCGGGGVGRGSVGGCVCVWVWICCCLQTLCPQIDFWRAWILSFKESFKNKQLFFQQWNQILFLKHVFIPLLM